MTRRQLIALLSASPVLASSPASFRAGCQTNAWPIDPQQPATFFSSLDAIHQLGYSGFETGFRNLAQLSRGARSRFYGLTFFGVHIFLTKYDPETGLAPRDLAAQVAARGASFGAQRLISSGTPPGKAGLRKKAEGLNELGRIAKAAGVRFAYHNHAPEFAAANAIDGRPEIESLLEGTDPALVDFLLDAGHAFEAGADITGFVKRHAARLSGLHLRDYKNGAQVPLGQGDFPLSQVAAALKEQGWSGWVLAEEERLDGSKPGAAAAGPARTAIRAAFGV